MEVFRFGTVRGQSEDHTAQEELMTSSRKQVHRYLMGLPSTLTVSVAASDDAEALKQAEEFSEKHDGPFLFHLPSTGQPVEVHMGAGKPSVLDVLEPGDLGTTPKRIEITQAQHSRGSTPGGLHRLTESERETVTVAWRLWNLRLQQEELIKSARTGDVEASRALDTVGNQIMTLELMCGADIAAMNLSIPWAPAGYQDRTGGQG